MSFFIFRWKIRYIYFVLTIIIRTWRTIVIPRVSSLLWVCSNYVSLSFYCYFFLILIRLFAFVVVRVTNKTLTGVKNRARNHYNSLRLLYKNNSKPLLADTQKLYSYHWRKDAFSFDTFAGFLYCDCPPFAKLWGLLW